MKFVLITIAGLALLTQPQNSRAESATGADHTSSYVGIWQLDRKASQPIEPLLALMEAPWIVRKMAAVATPTLSITTPGDGTLRMVNENPFRTTDRDVIADGAQRERTDALGRKVVESAIWNEMGQLVVTQQSHVDDDRIVEVTSTWASVGDTLELTLRTHSAERPLTIRRVFRPKP